MYADKDTDNRISIHDLTEQEAALIQSSLCRSAELSHNAEYSKIYRRVSIALDKVLPSEHDPTAVTKKDLEFYLYCNGSGCERVDQCQRYVANPESYPNLWWMNPARSGVRPTPCPEFEQKK